MKPLCCTLFGIACFDLTHGCTTSSLLLEKFIAEHIASQEGEWFPCMLHNLRSLQSAVSEVQAKQVELEQRIDALQIFAANTTTATEQRIDTLQLSTESTTRAAASGLQRLEDELSKRYVLLQEIPNFSKQQQSPNQQQPSSQQPLFQHFLLPEQHPHPQSTFSNCPLHAPSNNHAPQHFAPQQPPLQAPPCDPSMNPMSPRAPAFEISDRRVEHLRNSV